MLFKKKNLENCSLSSINCTQYTIKLISSNVLANVQ